MIRRRHVGLMALGCALALTVSAISMAETIRTIALGGNPAPGTNSVYDVPSEPVLNAAGTVLFRYTLNGGDANLANRVGLWTASTGEPELVVRAGDPAPGTAGGVVFANSSFISRITPSGQITFAGALAGPGIDDTNSTGIWIADNNHISPIVRRGEPAPGTSDAQFSQLSVFSIRIDAEGRPAFRAELSGPDVDQTNDEGIWAQRSAGLAKVARDGDLATDGLAGASFSVIGNPSRNPTGDLAFWARLEGDGITSSNDDGLWIDRSGVLSLVAREGDPLPALTPGTTLAVIDPSEPAFNDAGNVAFAGSASGIDGGWGVWSDRSGQLDVVTKVGREVPGTPAGVFFDSISLGGKLVMNADGNTAFTSGLFGAVDPSNDSGIWSEGFGALSLVAREGEQAPGAPNGVVFDSFEGPLEAKTAINGVGQVAFQVSVTGDPDTEGEGIWAQDRHGEVQLIVRRGDTIEVAPADFRTVEGLDFFGRSGLEDGRGSGFNELGQLAFRARFTDGMYGVFVSDKVAVPEPCLPGTILGALAIVLLSRSRYEKSVF